MRFIPTVSFARIGKYVILFIFSFSAIASFGQALPQAAINKYLSGHSASDFNYDFTKVNADQHTFKSGLYPFFKNTLSKIPEIKQLLQTDRASAMTDTIFVGDVPGDTLIITGTFFNNGPVLIFNDGVLIFQNANATMLGDIFVFQDGKLFCDSSTLNFPQVYFYQRGMIAANNGLINISNTTLDFGGLSHSLAVVDNAEVNLININNIGFTTAGGYGHASITIDGSNQAGEFIMTDSASFSFSNANTVLLWHHVPDNAVLDITFPNGISVAGYNFNNLTSGVSGIGYNVTMNNCTDVMWSLMPAAGSDVTVSSSTIRAIGLWFEGTDTINASGLVNNSNYVAFTAQLPDRNLQLNNSSLQTWSLYGFDMAYVNITGSIVGEVGSLGKSFITSQGILCDGSGGYYWASDTTLNIAVSSTVLGYIRSERNGICLLGYGSATAGASATGNSVMIVTQSSLPQDPIAYEHGVAWLVYINPPVDLYVDSIVNITGSAWIDQGPLGSFMDFGNYIVEYRSASSTNWIPLSPPVSNEVYNNFLAQWDTHGLSPGAYQLRLNTHNDLGDSIDAVIQVTLLPTVLGVGDLQSNNDLIMQVYFDGDTEDIIVDFKNHEFHQGNLIVFDAEGKSIYNANIQMKPGKSSFIIPAVQFASGFHTVNLIAGKYSVAEKVVIVK